MSDRVLLGDIGGTNARFALLDGGTIDHVEHLKVADYPTIDDAITEFLARHAAGGERGVSERAIGDEFALRDQDHPGDGKYQYQRQPKQGIDRAVGNAVLQQEQQDRCVQDRTLPLCDGRMRAAPRAFSPAGQLNSPARVWYSG